MQADADPAPVTPTPAPNPEPVTPTRPATLPSAFRDELVAAAGEGMNPGALMRAPVFLPDLQTPQNARAAVSSFTLLFDAVTVSFQLPLVGISGRSAGAPPVQARTMCIKCARVFHKEEMAYTCNATFH